MRYYTGIGSRETPDNVCESMTLLARHLDLLGFTLRSGGASGADAAFELGATNKEIFLPWRGFNNNPSDLCEPSDAAIALSKKLFHHFPGASNATRRLIARNMHQVFGPNIQQSPISEFIVCWTQDGLVKGGTAYAIKAAKHFRIPVYNLALDVDRIELAIKIKDIEDELTA